MRVTGIWFKLASPSPGEDRDPDRSSAGQAVNYVSGNLNLTLRTPRLNGIMGDCVKKENIMKLAIRAAAALFSLVCAGHAYSQSDYPSKPIRFIVPFPPGGGTDIVSRLVTSKMTETLGWRVVVDNRSGAGGSVGMEVAANSAPDGYTLVMGQTSNLAVNPSLYSKLPYQPLRDFAPVSLVSMIPITVMIAAKAPYKSIADLVSAAKAKPG